MNIELRDYLAAQALSALIQSPKFNGHMGMFVTDAYIIADAMIKERERISDAVIKEKPAKDGTVDMEA